jgi:hypothetical protein
MNFVTAITRQMIIAATVISLLTCVTFAGGSPGSGERIDGVPEGYKIIEGDIIVPIDFGEQLALGCWRPQRWSGGTVPYEFDSNVDITNKTRAIAAMAEWEGVSGVDFVPRNSETDYIHIRNSTTNSSSVGCEGGQQFVNIHDWTWKFIIVHELGHALGLWHEQSREDRDSYVWIHMANMDSVDMHNFEKHTSSDPTEPGFCFGPYDFNSVMQYSENAFSNNGFPTIEVLAPFEYWQSEIGQRDKLSAVDKLSMSNMYPGASLFTGHTWDPNNDWIRLSVADLVYMINTLSSDSGPITTNTLSWEYDGFANPAFPYQPTYGDLLQFGLYFTTGNASMLLTAKNPVDTPAQSDLQVTLPAAAVLTTGTGSGTYTIRLTNTGTDDLYLWMVTIPLELPEISPGQGTVTYIWDNELSAGGCNTTIREVTNGTPTDRRRFCILFMHQVYGVGPDPGLLAPGASVDLCNLYISWNINWGNVAVNFDQFKKSPALVPVTATSKTSALVVKSSSCALPVLTQSVWSLYHEGEYVDGDADGSGGVDIDDVVFSIDYIFTGGQPPVPYEAGDADCSGMIDIDDVVYLIEFIFAGGSPPENCSGDQSGSTKTVVGSAGVAVIDNIDAGDSFTLLLDADREVQAVQFEFTVSGDVSGLEANSLVDGMDVFFGEAGGMFKVGLIDINGQNMIPAGGVDIISISYEGDGTLELANSIAVAEGGGRLETQLSRQTTDGMKPSSFTLNQNYPNPFNPTTEISFSLPKTSHVTLTVYNIVGQSVAILVDGIMQAGDQSVTWHGTTDSGEPVSSGIYFYRISAGDFTDARKMVLMK